MKNIYEQGRPVSVPESARQAGEVRDRWSWVEARVWTDRMLTALEEGVKGGKWFSLMDKVYKRDNLESAFAKVRSRKGGPGVDNQTITKFEKQLTENLERLHHELRDGSYVPRPIKRTWIPKPGGSERRPLGIPTVRDRVVQAALRNVIEPIFEKDFAEQSYGFRPGRGCKDALRRVDQLLKNGHNWVVDADIKGYFDSIPHDRLMSLVEDKISDGSVLDVIRQFLQQEVMDTHERWESEEGTPQGAVISPLLSNIYLDPLDHLLAGSGFEMVRYADDFVILCRNEAEAKAALDLIASWTKDNGLTLHPDKTKIVDARGEEGFVFLGYHFKRGFKDPSRKSLNNLQDTIRRKTKRTSGISLEDIIKDINRTLIGWYEYFKHSYRTIFPGIDGWVRMRLRSILRKRHGKKGRGRGSDHQRWPIAYFAERGLFSMTAAHALASQSPLGLNH